MVALFRLPHPDRCKDILPLTPPDLMVLMRALILPPTATPSMDTVTTLTTLLPNNSRCSSHHTDMDQGDQEGHPPPI